MTIPATATPPFFIRVVPTRLVAWGTPWTIPPRTTARATRGPAVAGEGSSSPGRFTMRAGIAARLRSHPDACHVTAIKHEGLAENH